MVTFLPERVSSRAASRPAAPAPTIRKWVRSRGPSITKTAFWDVRLNSQPDWWFDQCLCRRDGSPSGQRQPRRAPHRQGDHQTKSRLISSSASVDFCRNSRRHHMYFSLHLGCVGAAAVATLPISHALVSAAPSQCEQVLPRFGDKLIDATCADSADLPTANLATTPTNNAIATLPPFA